MFQKFIAQIQAFLSNYDPLSTDYNETLHYVAQHLPESYSLQQIHAHLIAAAPAISDFGCLLAIDSCLSNKDRLQRGDEELAFSSEICLWVASKIGPGPTLVPQDEYPGGSLSELHTHNIAQFRMSADAGISIIYRLCTYSSPISSLDDIVFLRLLSFTDYRDPWTTSLAYEQAAKILAGFEEHLTSHEFLIERLVKTTIRPLFQKSKPSTITDQGRKAINQDAPDRYAGRTTNISSKPWKFEQPATTTLFRWAITNASVTSISDNWHLFVPPLLTIMDDPNTEIRARGCELLVDFLKTTPSKLLNQTGLADVFEDAAIPTLLYLPNLTPEAESLRLLPPAYGALYAVADTRFSKDSESLEYLKMLDRIMRQGILRGFFHAMEHVKIVELLIEQMGNLVQKMGLNAVKHLKDLVPILVGVLTDPLGSSRMENLLAATKTTQLIILNCWPRISESIYRIQLIQALALCWNGLSDSVVTDATTQAQGIKEELRVTAQLLLKSMEPGTGIEQELQLLLEVDGTLNELFELNTT